MADRKTPDTLRSARWFTPDDLRTSGHRSRIMQMGYSPAGLAGTPDHRRSSTPGRTSSPATRISRQRVEDVKRGILQAGGFPLELPAISLAEIIRQADHHALSQLPGHGGRGVDPLASGRWRRADGRLRQDHPGAAARRHQRRLSRDLHARRARCCAATGAARCWAPARIRIKYWDGAPGRDDHRRGLGRASNAASRAATAPA